MSETKKDNKNIGGFKREEIREAYFKRKLPQFIAKFQSKCEDIEEIEKLKMLLVEFKNSDNKVAKDLVTILGEDVMGIENQPDAPLAKFMGEMGEEEKAQFNAWRKSCYTAIETVTGIIKNTRLELKRKAVLKKDDWLDLALEIATLMKWVDEDRVYKDQMYRKILMAEKVKRNCSRIEAEEITKTSQEYRDYKLALLFKDNLTEFIMLCKKKGALDY